MLFRIVSDLHLELDNPFIPPFMKEDKETVLILAGDIHTGLNVVPWIRSLSERFAHIVYICGNHDFYGNDLKTLPLQLENAFLDISNVHYLHNSIIRLNNIRIIGSTLWTDMADKNPLAMFKIQQFMNDYVQIKLNKRKIRATDIITEFNVARTFIEEELRKPFDGKTVVVTHHAPSYKSVHQRFIHEGQINNAYYSDLDYLFYDYENIALWVHGHMHNSFDYKINNSRIICNPFGYHGYELNPNFDPYFIVEI